MFFYFIGYFSTNLGLRVLDILPHTKSFYSKMHCTPMVFVIVVFLEILTFWPWSALQVGMKKNPKILCSGLQKKKKIVFLSAAAFRIAFTTGFLGEFDFLYCLSGIWPVPLGFDKSVVIRDGGGQRGLSVHLLIDPAVVNWPPLTAPCGAQASTCRDVKEKHLAFLWFSLEALGTRG